MCTNITHRQVSGRSTDFTEPSINLNAKYHRAIEAKKLTFPSPGTSVEMVKVGSILGRGDATTVMEGVVDAFWGSG
jgi:hypothetical protein